MPGRTFPILLFALLGLTLVAALSADMAIYSDSHGNTEIHTKLVAEIAAKQPSLVFHCGDLTIGGKTQRNYDAFFEQVSPLSGICAIYPAMGNHDKPGDLFLNNFPQLGSSTYYTVENDSLLFIVLDSNLDLKPGSTQYQWLKRTLEQAECRNRFVILHHPIFSSGYHQGDKNLELFLPRLLSDHGVLAVFSGHDHHYERLSYQDVVYIVTGGGGGVLRKVNTPEPYSKFFLADHHYLILSRHGKVLECTAYLLDGRAIDRFQILLR